MRFPYRLRILGPALAVVLAPGLLSAQDAIGPAWEVRVVERMDAEYGVVREVVQDLSPAEVLRVQVELARHGHDPGVRNGVLDRPTRRALAAFQADRGLVICSCLSYETVVALGIAPVVVAREGGGRRVGYSAVYAYPPPFSSWNRYRGYASSVYYGHLPGGVQIGHDPYGRRVDHRPDRPVRPRPSDPRPARPEPDRRPDRRPDPPERRPEPRSGGRIRVDDPVRGSRPDDARPPARISRPDDDRPARPAP